MLTESQQLARIQIVFQALSGSVVGALWMKCTLVAAGRELKAVEDGDFAASNCVRAVKASGALAIQASIMFRLQVTGHLP